LFNLPLTHQSQKKVLAGPELCCELYLTNGIHGISCEKYLCTGCNTYGPGHYNGMCRSYEDEE